MRCVWGFRKAIARDVEYVLEGFGISDDQPIFLRELRDNRVQDEIASLHPCILERAKLTHIDASI